MGDKSTLTPEQLEVLALLRKHRCDFLAACTEEHWSKGESYYIDTRVNIPASLRKKFYAANPEAV